MLLLCWPAPVPTPSLPMPEGVGARERRKGACDGDGDGAMKNGARDGARVGRAALMAPSGWPPPFPRGAWGQRVGWRGCFVGAQEVGLRVVVGLGDGRRLGVAEGNGVGIRVGRALGRWLGLWLGFLLGRRLGRRLGRCEDGRWVGRRVGAWVARSRGHRA